MKQESVGITVLAVFCFVMGALMVVCMMAERLSLGIFALIWILAGIGIVMRKNWGRITFNTVTAGFIILALCDIIFQARAIEVQGLYLNSRLAVFSIIERVFGILIYLLGILLVNSPELKANFQLRKTVQAH